MLRMELMLTVARCAGMRPTSSLKETEMATSKTITRSSRGRARDRARVAGGQQHEVSYESQKTGKPKAAVRAAVKKVGNSRKKVDSELSK
jgi:hypothetical protein